MKIPGDTFWQFRLILSVSLLFGSLSLPAQEETSYHPLGEWRQITSSFGYRNHPLSRSGETSFHKGIDIAAQVGDSVYAWRMGIVLYSGSNSLSGKMINLLHAGGYMSKYHHLSQILVKEGDLIEAGQVIGRAGQTGQVSGPHLHFSVLLNNQHQDPFPFLKAALPVSQKPKQPPRKPETITANVFLYKDLLINSLPVNGKIYIDEEYYGVTPLSVKLSYGEHFVEIEAGEDYERFIGRLWIQEDFEPLYTAQLQLKGGQPAGEEKEKPAYFPGSESRESSGRE